MAEGARTRYLSGRPVCPFLFLAQLSVEENDAGAIDQRCGMSKNAALH
jgi:hypothetical protein